ncbi:MAG: SPOR domain-containing protein [Pseudomonadota bacterium]
MAPHRDGETSIGLCQASRTAEDPLSALADLVGTGETLHPAGQCSSVATVAPQRKPVAQPAIRMVDDAPALEFDLEQELAQAFEKQMGIHTQLQPEATPVLVPEPVPAPSPAEMPTEMTEPVAAAAAAISFDNLPLDKPAATTAFDKVLLRDTAATQAVETVLPELEVEQAPVPQPSFAPTPEMVDLERDLDDDLEAALDAELSLELEKALEEESAAVAAPMPVEPEQAPTAAVNSEDMASILAAMPQTEATPMGSASVANIFGGLNPAPSPAMEPASAEMQPMDDFRRELSRLMGGGAAAGEGAGSAVHQPAPMPMPQARSGVAEMVATPPVSRVPEEVQPLALPEFDPAAVQDFELQAANGVSEVDAFLATQDLGAQPHSQSQDVAVEAFNNHGASVPVSTVHPEAVASAAPVVDPFFDDPAYSDPAAQPSPSHFADEDLEADNDNGRRKGIFAAAVVGAIALIGGAAAIGLSSFGGDGPAPEILASSEPVKVKPAQAGGQVVPNQDQAVFQSDADKPANQATLNESAEKPITVALNNGASKNEDRITTGDTGAPVQSRRVRTVVVRPDGTIVSNSADPTTVTSAVPVETPTLTLQPSVPQAQPVQPAAPSTVTYSAPQAGDTPAAPQPQQVARLETAPVKLETVPVKPAPAPVQPPVAKKPAPKPAAPARSAASGLPSVSSPYAVQIASQRSPDAAQRSYSTLSRRYASVLRGKGVDIRRAVIDGKGTFYRVRIPAQTRGEANTLCRRLKASGGSCFVTR